MCEPNSRLSLLYGMAGVSALDSTAKGERMGQEAESDKAI